MRKQDFEGKYKELGDRDRENKKRREEGRVERTRNITFVGEGGDLGIG